MHEKSSHTTEYNVPFQSIVHFFRHFYSHTEYSLYGIQVRGVLTHGLLRERPIRGGNEAIDVHEDLFL